MDDTEETDSTREPERESTRGPETTRLRGLSRRRVLALSGALAGSIAGCSGDGGGDSTPTPADTTATPTPTDTTATPTESSERTPFPTPTDTPTPSSRTRLESPVGAESPSSDVAPGDGFASVDWTADLSLTVVKVTNLEKSGEGSLKRALELPEPRLIVFEVGGVIDLEGEAITVTQPGAIVAGQTAPPPGITIVRGAFRVDATDVLVQHVRVRTGDEAGEAYDAMSTSRQSGNVIFDHCSATWGIDECMSVGGTFNSFAISFTNNIVGEGLYDSIHPEGPHSMGSLVFNGALDVAIMGNAYSTVDQRTPRLKGGTHSVVVNNVSYNFGDAIMVGGGPGDKTGTAMSSAIVGNAFLAGEVTDPEQPIVFPRDDAVGPQVYLEDNRTEPSSMPMTDDRISPIGTKPQWPGEFEALPASEVVDHNLATVGARPAERTPHDERFVRNIRERSGGGLIDSQSAVGGYPDLESTERELDVPDSGVGEWLRRHTRAVELPDAEPP